MLTKRGKGELTEVESKIGRVYLIPGEVILFIPNIGSSNEPDKIKNEQVNYLYFLMETHEVKHAIVPYSSLAPQASEMLHNDAVYRVELFKYRHLLFDPTAHKYTPPHVLVQKEELGSIKVKDLPRILLSDSIVRFYDWKPGSIIRIERPDGIYYRVVIRDP